MVLGIESSTGRCGAALVRAGELIGECSLGGEGATSDQLHHLVQFLTEKGGLTPHHIDGIAVSIGPGSFTGLRVGLAAAKGLALALSKPIVGISSLAAMAWDVPFACWPVAPALDARKGEMYIGLYSTAGGVPEELSAPVACAPEELPVVYRDTDTLFLGTGALVYREALSRLCGAKAHFVPVGHARPRASAIAFLGAIRLERGEEEDAAALVPSYLRPSEAELARRRRHSSR